MKKSEFEAIKAHKELSAELDELTESIGDQGYIDKSEVYAPEIYEFAM